jgi:hypothetical protein
MRSRQLRVTQHLEQLERRVHLSASVRPAAVTRAPTVGLVHTTARLSTARWSPAPVTVGTKAVFAGSQSGDDDVVDLYDGVTRQWSSARLSQARWLMGVTVVGGKALFAGGTTGNNFAYPPLGPSAVVDIYDSATDRWSTGALSLARFNVATATAGHKALFAGGATPTDPINNVVDIYDADTGGWSTGALSQARSGFAAATVGQLALFAGGAFTDGNGTEVDSTVVDIYNGATGQWSTAALSQARGAATAVVVNGKVIFAGGLKADGTPSDVVDIFDSNTGQWTTATLSVARFFMGTAVVDGQAVFTGQMSSTTLSHPGDNFAGVAVGDKAIFAGAEVLAVGNVSDAVDVYDGRTRQWSTTTLVRARRLIGATTVGNQALFAGGDTGGTEQVTNLIDIFTFDPTDPTATLLSAATRKRSRAAYTFTVTYHDDFGMNTDALDGNDIIVDGPDGYERNARLVSLERGKHGSTRVATYAIHGPGRRWDASDNGVYTLHLQDGQVTDLAANAAVGRRIGKFIVAIPTAPPTSATAPLQRTLTPFQSRRIISDLLET